MSLAASWAGSAAAEGGPSTYVVPAECPERAVWLEGLRARLPPLLRTHPLVQSLSVRVDSAQDSYVGSIASDSMLELGGARSVRGATCTEVLDALGFIGALGLERALGGQVVDAAPPPPLVTGSTGATLSDTNPGAEQPSPRPLHVGVAGFALLQNGLTPGAALGLGAAVQFEWSTANGRAASWQPLLLLGAYFAAPADLRVEGGGALRLQHWSSHTVFCPWRFPATGFLALRPCVDFDAGRSSGEGVGVISQTKRAAPWLSTSAELRGELQLGQGIELGASLEAVAPLWRSHFYLLPDVMRFETPAFGLRAGSTLSLLF